MIQHLYTTPSAYPNKRHPQCPSPISPLPHPPFILQYHLTLVRVAKMNKSGDSRCWRGREEMATLLHCWWERKLDHPLWKTVWRFLKKLKIEPPYDLVIALPRIYPGDTGVMMHRGTCTPKFRAALSTTAKLWEEPKCPSTDEWIKKMWFIYTMNTTTWQ